jgi:predicted HTH transcriptional regulator
MTEMERERIERLVKRPQESLAVEIKTWIDPTKPAGQEKIIKAAIALRNHGGGSLIIGLNNESLKAERDGMPEDVRAAFHVDVIQGMVAKYSSETFEVAVEFVEHEGVTHPVIVIPPGIQTPVAAKATLTGDGGKVHIEKDAVYVRTRCLST